MPVIRRKCKECGVNRAERYFPTDLRKKDKISDRCQYCKAKAVKKQSHASRIAQTYEITGAEYDALFEAQGGVCAICKGKRTYRLDVDHSHKLEAEGKPMRECIRGLLCRNCNRQILRKAKDDATVLRSAADYLDNPPARALLSVARALSTDASKGN